MKTKQLDLFRDTAYGKSLRLSINEAMDLTCQSLTTYGGDSSTWVVGFSGGKDSTATLTFIDYAIRQDKVKRPENLVVIYADTLMELPSLEHSAHQLLNYLSGRGWRIFRTEPSKEDYRYGRKKRQAERFFINMLGRGYPPPSNKFRWCTERMKGRKVADAYKSIASEYGKNFLGIDGIRWGESEARDQRILTSCSSKGGECGQGWFHEYGGVRKLSPLLHWRLCHVWDWIFIADIEHGYPITGVSETYGVNIDDDPDDLSGRTGCIGCPLVTAGKEKHPKPDKALETVILSDRWSHLTPYRELSDIYWELRWNPTARHYKTNGNKGCLTLAARKWALNKILRLQDESIRLAIASQRTPYLIIRPDEESIIRKMLDAGAFPQNRGYSAGELQTQRPFQLSR